MTYLERLPKPLIADVFHKRCLPILGSGFSRNALLPAGRAMPLWRELGDALAAQMATYAGADRGPIDAFSAYQDDFGRPRLIQEVRRLLHDGVARPGETHLAFCRLPFDIVVTTNIDTILEHGYDAVLRNYNLIVDGDQLSIGVDESTVTVLKMHGDVMHPSRLVLTEEDYDLFLSRNPLLVTFLSSLLITRTPLFIGYSLDDPDLRQILTLIGDRLGKQRRQAYVLTHGVTAVDVARYARRGVRCLDLA
jgi:SIR2-like domain